MIVEMRRMLIVGPRRLLDEVVEAVQGAGAVHVDQVEPGEAAAPAVEPEGGHSEALAALERTLVRVEWLLGVISRAAPALGGAAASPDPGDDRAIEARLEAIESEATALTRRRLELEEELELIRTYEGAVRALGPLISALSGSRSLESVGFLLRGADLTAVTALRGQLEGLTEGRVEVAGRLVDGERTGVVVAFLRRDAEAVRGFLSRAGIVELRLPERYAAGGPAETVRQMERRRAELPAEIAAVGSDMTALASRHGQEVREAHGQIQDRLGRLRAVSLLARSRYAFILRGWVPAAQVEEVRSTLRSRFGEDVVVEDTPADPHYAEAVPVLLDNPGPVRPFQRMLALFRPPRYGTLDPTVYLAIFFPLFVGVVIGDVAYGALLFALGWWMRGKSARGEPWEISLFGMKLGITIPPGTLADASWIIRVLSVWTMLFGVVYLEIFGNLIEHHLGLHPVFNRVQLAAAFLGVAIALGIVQVMLGYLLHLGQALRHRHPFHALESLAMISGVLALFALLGTRGEVLPPGFFGLGLLLGALFLALVAVGVVLNRFALMWLLEAISGVGSVLSYARLFGVGLAAAALANASNELGAAFGPMWVGIVMGIVIQMVFFLFTIAGHIIQPARLNWVEFLTKVKYHDETGNSYRPLQKTGGG